MAGIGKNRGGMPSRALDKNDIADGAGAGDDGPDGNVDPADVARFRDAMKSDGAKPTEHDKAARDLRSAERADEAERLTAARQEAASRDRVENRRETDAGRRHDDDDDKGHDVRDEGEAQHDREITADDLQLPQDGAASSDTGSNAQQGTSTQPAPQNTSAMMQAAETVVQQQALATADGGVGASDAHGTIQGIAARRAGHGVGHDGDEIDDDPDGAASNAADSTSGVSGGFEVGRASDDVEVPEMRAGELVELAEKLVDQIRVSIPDSPGAAVTLTLGADVLQGAEITLVRDAEGLRVSIQTPSSEIADRVGSARDQLARRLGDRLNERVQVAVVGPSTTQRSLATGRTYGRRDSEFEDDDDR